jgi:2'-5' RNA ligase
MISRIQSIFLGIPLPKDILMQLLRQTQEFPGKNIPPQNWHLTVFNIFWRNIFEILTL